MAFVIGLTGSIAMGKSFIAKIFEEKSIKIFDCDKEVGELIANDEEVISELINNFPEIKEEGTINKNKLAGLVLINHQKMDLLESIIHPIIKQKILDFIAINNSDEILLLEVPLLFEAGIDKLCNKVIVATASASTQAMRLNLRKKLSNIQIDFVLSRQMPDEIKKKKADIVINTEKNRKELVKEIDMIIAGIR